ncbi:MAG TPA: adenosylcobinamide-phosphate synthase CbiB [Ramlibacter sp.]|jgi:adenosylcobinamide-phosphate synthase|uniref:adenosylcobinamide-phosphate synthase CbiB n=1 Tax=Ramlibacter sp. TaxID=1917967 RepID=UPI002D3A54FC|nr:adenosylcobinamide-phosphate synthase CbiB [Ramlibacter sp.]HZY18076.1 adenosylcobinamide-phosphate synthase CbiB [Ramlibacter sp.]
MPAWSAAVALVFALALDRAFGEPPSRWHPVAWMGRYLGWIGHRVAPRGLQQGGERRLFCAGAFAWWGGALLVLAAALGLQLAADALGPWLGALLAGAVLKTMLAWRMLRDEVAGVEDALAESLDAGRRRLGRLVSREVMRLDESLVRESAIESLAENLNDSVVAPVFWFLVAGLPGAMLYRFANTADAMWGYRGLRAGLDWTWAGKWAARTDDVLSWLPARLTALLLGLLAGGLPLRELRLQARCTPSPNGGWPMAAMALALGVRLRKPGVYALNGEASGPEAQDTRRALRLAGASVGALLGASAALLLGAAWLGQGA